MAGYTRQSSFADGDTITAALFNNEYNQLVNAFNNSTGHAHDGTAASGPVIGLIGDAGETSPNNKVLIDTTNNHIEFYVEVSSNPVQQIFIGDGVIAPVTDSDVDIGTTSLRFKDAFIDSITTTGNVAVGGNLTVTGTTTFNGGTITMGDAATDNVVFGADVDSNIIPDDDNTYDLGSSSQQWKDIYIDGVAYLDAIDFNGTTITATAAELNILDGVTSTATELNLLDGVTATTTELNYVDVATAGTVEASKAVVVDSNKDFTGARNITITGEIDAATLDISGNADIDGTLETDALSINGTTVTSTAAELNILDGVTSTATELNLLDGVTATTAELNILDGVTSTATELNLLDGVTSTTAELNILDGVTATAAEINTLDGITSTVAELNILDGVTASAADINLIDGITNGTVIASKAIITDSNKDITGGRNITISGELDAATLDISGDADIDGTLEADAITIAGVTLAETISDTVGAMVSSNTETNITVSYDDSDNTLDFVIGTLNQDTTGNAATATALETARTIHGVSFDGTANIDLSEVIQDTVGAMVSSNTESGITVAYEDSDGTLDFTIGTLNQNTTGSAATLTTARTIGGVSFDGSANIVPTTFNAATFSGDVNVDSGVLFVDVSENRIGVNQTSPDVSLDLGSNTDSIHVPVGTTAQRPSSPAAGYFRYNTTTGGFEGYTDAWGAIAGSGGGTAPSLDTMTGDGSDITLTLSTAPVNENATFVTIDGVLQHKDTYSISGNTLTFSEAPPSGAKVESITLTTTTSTTANILSDADADTKIQVEESSDEDKIRFDTGGTERVVIDSNGITMSSGTVNGLGILADTTNFEDSILISQNASTGTLDAASNNTGLGDSVFAALTRGDNNVGIGADSLKGLTTGGANVAVGFAALEANTTASNNVAVGFTALLANTTGSFNVAVGKDALAANTTAAQNTAVGGVSMASNTTGANNTALGTSALNANTTASNNVAVGTNALVLNTTGSNNTAVGMQSLDANTTGTTNTAIGKDSLGANTTGSANTGLGHNALEANTTASDNTGVGKNALRANTTGGENTALGKDALSANTTGTNNLSLGSDTMLANTTGSNNVAVGYGALQVNSTADDNTAVGDRALFNNTTGAHNSALGHDALKANTTGESNVAVGSQSLDANTTGLNNVAVGRQALDNSTTGSRNVAVGTNALDANTTADHNTAVGDGALKANTTGAANIAVGSAAGNLITTGSQNVILGGYSGNHQGLDVRTESDGKAVVSDGAGDIAFHNAVGTAILAGNVDVTGDSSSANAFALADGAVTGLFGGGNGFSGVFILNDFTSSGEVAMFITGGGVITLVKQTGVNFEVGSSPASGKYGLFMDGTTVKLKSNRGASASFRLLSLRTRTGQ